MNLLEETQNYESSTNKNIALICLFNTRFKMIIHLNYNSASHATEVNAYGLTAAKRFDLLVTFTILKPW